jgi:hypothetical protein
MVLRNARINRLTRKLVQLMVRMGAIDGLYVGTNIDDSASLKQRTITRSYRSDSDSALDPSDSRN